MMYRRDYILRLIERFGRLLITLRDRILRRETDRAVALAQIGEMAQQAGLDLDLDSLLMWLAPGEDVDQPRLWLAGELLYLTALQAVTDGEGDSRGDLRRALAVLARLPRDWKPSNEFVTAGERADEIRALLDRGSV
jgi:hypothetical protein